MPVNGNYFSSNNAYITTDKQGAYSHTFSVLEPRFVTATNNFVSAYLFVELGHIYQVDYVDDSYKMGGIPYYMILDKNGQPVVWNAKRPSDKNELIEQLKNVIRKNSKQFLTLLL